MRTADGWVRGKQCERPIIVDAQRILFACLICGLHSNEQVDLCFPRRKSDATDKQRPQDHARDAQNLRQKKGNARVLRKQKQGKDHAG